MTARITKTLCPSCEGSGKLRSLDIACMWCSGEKRVAVEVTTRYADHVWMLAGGGYVVGDYDLAEMRKMEAKAKRIYDIVGSTPPWEQPAKNFRGVASAG